MALERGHQMRGLGITVDFAPDVDVTDAPDDTVIGDRSFSDGSAEIVVEYARSLRRRPARRGLRPVLKHFPGHGHGSGDSHTGSVIVTPPLSQLQNNDLVPFRTLLNDRSRRRDGRPPAGARPHRHDQPASVNRAAVQMLRTGVGYNGPAFNGPIFSDDLSSMAAIKDHYTVPDAVLRASRPASTSRCGSPPTRCPRFSTGCRRLSEAKELKMSDIDDSVRRIAKFKGPKPDCGP